MKFDVINPTEFKMDSEYLKKIYDSELKEIGLEASSLGWRPGTFYPNFSILNINTHNLAQFKRTNILYSDSGGFGGYKYVSQNLKYPITIDVFND